jgi:hypothetical protein
MLLADSWIVKIEGVAPVMLLLVSKVELNQLVLYALK